MSSPDDSTHVHVLIADARPDVRDALRRLLESNGHVVETTSSLRLAIAAARERELGAALVGLTELESEEDVDLLQQLIETDSTLPVIVIAAADGVERAVAAVRAGARDYFESPWNDERLLAVLRTQCEIGRMMRVARRLEDENSRLRDGARDNDLAAFDGLTLDDAEARLIRRALEKHRGNVSRAAVALGLSRSALYRRLQRHGLSP